MEMREKILASALRLAQTRGFNGFSYADIAKEVGIRKASLHHHFPTKADLGMALIGMYAGFLDNALNSISASSAPVDKKLAAYVDIYRNLLDAKHVCLGGMLASEALTLDESILPGLNQFFMRNTKWLTGILAEGEANRIFVLKGTASSHAYMLVSALQGALMLARATGNRKAFDQTASLLIAGLLRKG